MDFTEEVDSYSGKSVSKGGLYPPRVGLAASSEARAVIETQGVIPAKMKESIMVSLFRHCVVIVIMN